MMCNDVMSYYRSQFYNIPSLFLFFLLQWQCVLRENIQPFQEFCSVELLQMGEWRGLSRRRCAEHEICQHPNSRMLGFDVSTSTDVDGLESDCVCDGGCFVCK